MKTSRVAVLLGGYGEAEHEHEHEEYNERALRLLVSKSIRFPEPLIPWMARLLGRRVRREWEREDHFHSPHNEIFEQQRAGIEHALVRRFGPEAVSVFTALNFTDGLLPAQVLRRIREAGFDRLAIYPLEVLDSVFTSGLVLQQVNEAVHDDGEWVREVRYLPSFADRPEFHHRLAGHIREGALPLLDRYAATQIGVMLLLHGCPLESKGHEVGIRESEALYRAVRALLVPRFPLIHIGWMNHPTPAKWTSPDMETSAANLIELGAQAIVFAPIGFVTENHETVLDVSYVERSLAGKVETLRLPSLNADPAFLEMAAGWIAPYVSELLHGHDCCVSDHERETCCTT
jgi:protoporphyrin/coproporphyrin ferrochelatase